MKRSRFAQLMLVLFALSGPTVAADTSDAAALAEAVARAERLGKALAEAIPSAPVASRATLQRARDKGAELCDFDYKEVLVNDGNLQLTFLVATTGKRQDIVLGRHFLLTDSGAEPSTRTCLNMGAPSLSAGQKPVATAVTHLLSPTPNEFHVYLSLIQPVPLMVMAEVGTWFVRDGRIGFAGTQLALSSAGATDRPKGLGAAQFAAMDKAIKPYVARAKKSYPAARDRYLAGLPPGDRFFVTTRLRDKEGRQEQVFIRVTKIAGSEISGLIANDLNVVTGYRSGQAYSFPDTELLDWTIVKPGGSEEGNVVGKFLDTYRP